MRFQERWKSKTLWIAFAAQLVSLLLLFKVIDLRMGETINIAVAIVCEMLVSLGIFNNPQNAEKV